ncbi:MAG: hypothetical protein DDT19_01579 [Syntrophomonadaceae bacterium]|nr:hypothetical protein [Bacillota bacterium]
MRKFIFIIIFISIFIFSSGVFVETVSGFIPAIIVPENCLKVISVTKVTIGGFTDIHVRLGTWTYDKDTCRLCWGGGRPPWAAFRVFHNNPMIHWNPFTVWWSWAEELSVIPTEGLSYHLPECGWAVWNSYSEIIVIVPVPSPLAAWPYCGETFDFKGDVSFVHDHYFIGDQYFPARAQYLASVSYTLTPRLGCEFRPSHSFVGGRGPGAKGSGATLESHGVGLGGGGLQGRGVTGYEIRYR